MAFLQLSLAILLAQIFPAAAADKGSPLSVYGTQICTGMVEAFLHKANLTRGEVDCMVSAMGDVALGAYESAENVASLMEQIAGLPGPGADREQPLAGPAPLVLELARSMHGLVHVLDGVMGTCVRGHSLELLNRAADHLGNLTYITGRLAANGADVVDELSDAMTAFRRGDCKRFGSDVGTACRKVLLSSASSELLPEGPPSLQQLINVSAGVLQGFFGEGFELTVGSDTRIVSKPSVREMDFIQDGFNSDEAKRVVVTKDRSRLNVRIDLHRCVSENLDLFRAVMSKAWLYFAEAALQPEGHEMRRFFAVMLHGLPGALARCGVEPEQQLMLADSIRSLRHVQLRLRMPKTPESAGRAAEELRAAAADWSKLSWFAFGNDLGRMLQGLAVEAHPERYALTSMGSLRRAEKEVAEVAEEAHEQLESAEGPSADELARGGFESADELGAGSGLSVTGVRIVEGIAEGLLHRDSLSKSEAECLMSSVGSVAGGARQTAESLAEVAEALIAGTAPQGAQPLETAELLGELMRSFDGVARLAEGFMASCRSSAAEAFQLALGHVGSLRYVTGRLAANGADVTEGIDRAVAGLRQRRPRAFGLEVGRVLRKMLLSSKSRPVLPEGNSTLPEMVNVTAGVLEGFFGEGFELDISSDQKIVTGASFFPMAALLGGTGAEREGQKAQRLNVHIDLHSCVKKNLPYFESVMAGVMQTIAVEEVGPSPGAVSTPWMMAGLAGLPEALSRCGVDADQEQALLQSVQTLNKLHTQVQLPEGGHPLGFNRSVELIKRCVSDWSKLQWFALGKDLGTMLREAMVTYSQEIDVELATLLGRSDAAVRVQTGRTTSHMLTSAQVLAMAGALAFVAGMLALARRLGRPTRDPKRLAQLDLGSDIEDFEVGLARASALE